MRKFFSELSSKADELLSSKPKALKPETPKFEDWSGWCEDIAKFCKEKANWNQKYALLEEKYVDAYKDWLPLDQSRLQRCEEMISLYGDQIRRWHEEELRFHKEIARFHRDEAYKSGPCPHLHEKEACFHEDRARFHQSKADECKLITDHLKDHLRYNKDEICYDREMIYCCKEEASLYKEFFSLYQTKISDMSLTRRKLLYDRKKELFVREEELTTRRQRLGAWGKDLKAHAKKYNVCLYDQNDHEQKLFTNLDKINASRGNLSARIKSFEDHRLQLLQHPNVLQRRELIRVLQNIRKVLLKRSNKDILFLENENAIVIPLNFIYAIKLILNWLESSIFKELGVLGIKVAMTM
jgi:hypothetical protein